MAKKKKSKEMALKDLKAMGLEAKERLYQALAEKMTGGILTPSELKIFDRLSKELDADKPDDDLEGVFFQSMQKAADYAGVSKTTIKYHCDRKRIIVDKKGRISKASVDQWLKTKGKKDGRKKTYENLEAGEDNSDLPIKKELADLRYRLAKADKEEVTAALLKGKAYYREDVIKDWCKRVALVKAGLMAFADRLPPLVEGKNQLETREILQEETTILLESFATKGKYTPKEKRKK